MPSSQLKQFLLASTVLGKVRILVEKLLNFNTIIRATQVTAKRTDSATSCQMHIVSDTNSG
jgi:hypothetical protein